MRTKPVGTGPFKFVEFKANESIKLTKNPDYFKKGLPHLDGIEFTIITNRSTAILGFVAGKFDMTFPTHITIPLLKDVKSQAPNAVCVVEPTNALEAKALMIEFVRREMGPKEASVQAFQILGADCRVVCPLGIASLGRVKPVLSRYLEDVV